MNIKKISRILTERKDDLLDKAILRAGMSGIISLIEDNAYKLTESQAKAIAEYLRRWHG